MSIEFITQPQEITITQIKGLKGDKGDSGEGTSLATCDITVANIEERDLIIDVVVGKQVHVLSDDNGKSSTFVWNGVDWSPILFDHVDFDTTETIIPQFGRVGWDADEQTLAIGLENGVTLQVGQEMNIRAKNVSGSTILDGQVVYISGASGDRAEVLKAIATSDLSTRTIAMATESVSNNNNGYFTTIGLVHDIDTSAFTEGSPLYLSADISGGITDVKPTKPNYCVCIGYVIRSHATEGRIYVKIGSSPKLKDLSDIDVQSLANGDQIYYDSATSTWKNIESGFNLLSRWDDIILPSESLGTGASAPDLIPINGSNLRMYGFAGTSTSEQLYGSFELVHTYKEGTDLRPHIHWCPTTTDLGNVKWQLEYEIRNNQEVFTGVTTNIVAIDSANGIAYENNAVEFGIISGVNLHIGAQCKFRLYRIYNDVEDTYESDAGLLTLGVHYEIDGDGSRTTFTK